jgi:hypothetical protein
MQAGRSSIPPRHFPALGALSPNMPTPDTAPARPGMCLAEGPRRGGDHPGARAGAAPPAIRAPRLPTRSEWPRRGSALLVHAQGGMVSKGPALPRRADPPKIRARSRPPAGVAAIVHARAQDPAKFHWRTEKHEFVGYAGDRSAHGGSARARAEQGARWPSSARSGTRSGRVHQGRSAEAPCCGDRAFGGSLDPACRASPPPPTC